MVKWYDRTPRDVTRALLQPRHHVVEGDRVLLQDLSPEPSRFLGQAASLQLAVLQQAARVVQDAPSLASKAALVDVVRIVSARYRALVDLIDGDPVEAMRLFASSSERFARETSGADWYELLLSLHVTTGLLTDFFVAYAGGLPDEDRGAVLRAIQVETGHPLLVRELQRAIAENPRLASKLAMWGRRLVGDTLLQMYLAVNGPEQHGPTAARLEPAFNDIVAAHTRRMDALGLTA